MEEFSVDREKQNRTFGSKEKCYIWWKANSEFQHKNLILSIKYGTGNIIIWVCFADFGKGQFAIIDGTMSSGFLGEKWQIEDGFAFCRGANYG